MEMRDKDRTKEQLIQELIEMRRQNADLRATNARRKQTEKELSKCRSQIEGLVRKHTQQLAQTKEELQREIADRRQIQEQLRESILILRTAVESLPFDFFIIDESGHYIMQNSVCREHWGELIGKRPQDVAPDEDTLTLWKHNNSRAFAGEVVTGEVALVARNDEGYYYNIISPIYDGDHIHGIMGVNIDITERKLAEEALRESKLRYRNIIAQANGVAYQCDFMNGIYTFIDKGIQRITGYSQNRITPELFESLIEEKVQYTYTAREMATRSELSRKLGGDDAMLYRADYCLRSLDGKMFWVADSAVQFRDPRGKLTGAIGMLQDITDRKRMENELMKVQRLESVSVLAGGLAHDFNNLLGGILGNISLAEIHLDRSEPKKAVGKLREAEKACIRAKGLTHQLLTFSKGGAPVKKLADIGEILRDSAVFALSGSNVKCEFSISANLWQAEVDSGQISQVISNLVINAEQSMPEGGIIKISAENMHIDNRSGLPLNAGLYIRFSVRDQGVGIPERIQHRIFDPFFTTKQTGSGLGLATSHSIVDKHGGYITVESKIGVGTEISTYLPASVYVAFMGPKTQEEIIALEEGKILIVDDEDMFLIFIHDTLSAVGYEVITSTDGSEAIDIYIEAMGHGSPFDVVILDLTIPGGMGGREIIQELMKVDPSVRAIVSSGYSNDPVMANYMDYGFVDVLPKPYKAGELRGVLSRVLTATD